MRRGIVDDGWMGEMMLGQEENSATKGILGNISFPCITLRSLSILMAECRYRSPTKAVRGTRLTSFRDVHNSTPLAPRGKWTNPSQLYEGRYKLRWLRDFYRQSARNIGYQAYFSRYHGFHGGKWSEPSPLHDHLMVKVQAPIDSGLWSFSSRQILVNELYHSRCVGVTLQFQVNGLTYHLAASQNTTISAQPPALNSLQQSRTSPLPVNFTQARCCHPLDGAIHRRLNSHL